jgi:pullulanase
VLNIYDYGTPITYASVAPSNVKTQAVPSKRVQMVKGQQGVWEVTIPSNLHGKYYTYSVTNGSSTNEVVDPYAKSCGINGLRGMVVDFDQINESLNWSLVTRPTNITNATDASIYEAHVRDLTIDASSGVNDEYRGKFLGLTDTTSTYSDGSTTVTTGIRNIVDLGVSHVQLQPIYDYSSVDETTSTGYNWGYDPLNYNCLEGSYSTNPWDGENRIIEFKQMMKTFCEEGIQVNMDVVYNHTAGSGDTNFELIVPGYYHRFNEDGSYSNGSGCGNEMASERPMMRKFIVDSTSFWLDEYKLSGFRFDLMGLIDTTTMDTVYKNLQKIYPQVLVYGEPWTGGTSTCNYIGCSDYTIQNIAGVGAFNDTFRDAARGNNSLSLGWAQGGSEIDGMWKGMYGQLGDNAKDPLKTVNYVSCHDNYTLYDQLSKTMSSSSVPLTMTQIQSLVFFNQGIPFIHGGEEIFRTKSAGVGDQIHNSYNAGDSVNKFDYSRKITYLNEYNTIKDAINLRKAFAGFRLTTNASIESALSSGEVGNLYKIEINYGGETYLVAASNKGTTINASNYTCVFSNNNKTGLSGSTSFSLAAHEIAVFKK